MPVDGIEQIRELYTVTFTSEDVRATAISAFIQAEKAAMGGRY